MATISKWGLVALAGLLAGCADTPAYAPNKLSWPSARLMKAPAALPSVPQEEGNPAVRAPYLASTISQCSATADQVRGLQDYARAIHSK
jgi:hypothetical protein